MKLPKIVNISGKNYSVRQNKRGWGGKGFKGKQELTVGTKKNQTAERVFENYLHEVVELITCERDIRYEASDDRVMVFVMNHKEFNNFVGDLSTAIFPMIKE